MMKIPIAMARIARTRFRPLKAGISATQALGDESDGQQEHADVLCEFCYKNNPFSRNKSCSSFKYKEIESQKRHKEPTDG
jgi:hypothetical protein